MKLKIFSTRLASQQHQHEAGNLQHEAGINNISTKLEIFSTRLASTTSSTKLEIFNTRLASTTSARSWKSSTRGWHKQHQHEAGNLQHKTDITTSCGTPTDPLDLPRNQKIP
jgi:hypothetical protein